MSTLLIQQARDRNFENVQFLLEEIEQDVNFQDEYGHCALHEAARNLDIAMLYLLLENEANPNLANHEGRTALNHAYAEYHPDAEAALLMTISILLDAGASPDHTDQHGDTALCWAAYNGLINIAQCLIEAGANPATAIGHAEEGGHDEMICLLRKRCSPEAQEINLGSAFDDDHIHDDKYEKPSSLQC